MAFQMGLSEQVRARVEYAGRVVLSDAEIAVLVRTKTVHELLITLAVLVGVASTQVAIAIPIVLSSFWVAGIVEVFLRRSDRIAWAVGMRTAAFFGGICAIVPLAAPSI